MRRLVVLLGIAATVGLAVPAQADPGNADAGVDASFLDALTKAGITFSLTPSTPARQLAG
jgi:hypothetical protein